jgi:RimJ/RimL family protein N-acetyltransferase
VSDDRGSAIELGRLSGAALQALADGDLATAEASAPVPLSPYLAGPECRWVWAMRAGQVVADPPSADWITRVVWDPDRRLAVGRAGFHGPPDDDGMVEVGYSIDPAHRRRGYARAALRALLERAAGDPAVTTVRASVAPGNVPSRDLVLGEGFVEVGSQIDEEDGLEIVYEVAAGARLG